jgi:hypothetical protein
MLPDRRDITSRISDPIKWWDEDGCPRYNNFHPDMLANIYAREAALLDIQCQACEKHFLVAMSQDYPSIGWEPVDKTIYERRPIPLEVACSFKVGPKMAERIDYLHYGDPPIHGCVGDTMNCEDKRVVQFWRCDKGEWERVPELEREIVDEFDVDEFDKEDKCESL